MSATSRTRRGSAYAIVGVAAVVLAGCNGGTVDRHALKNDASTLDSIACEGALLAHEVSRGRTTKFFAREQAEELRIQSSNFADSLSRRKTVPHIELQVRAQARRAALLASMFDRLHDHPTERPVGTEVERTLTKLGACP